jgi:hypothetical protein
VIDPGLRKELDSQEWVKIYPALTHYAILLSRSLKGKISENNLPKGYQAKDLAQEAISLVYQGKRKWDPNKVPDILVYLKGVVKSIFSHLFESPAHLKRQDVIEKNDKFINLIEETRSNNTTPLEELECEDLWNYLWDFAKDDENIQMILLCLDEEQKRGAIAEFMEMPPEDIDKYLKKIRRACNKFYKNNE